MIKEPIEYKTPSKQNKTITFVTTSFPISGDGSEAAGSFVLDFVEEIAKQKYFVNIVAPGNKECIEQLNDRIKIYRYPAPPKPLSTLSFWKLNDLVWMLRIIRHGKRIVREAAKESFHIFALWALPSGEWARQISKELGIEYSVWILGSDIWSLGKLPIIRAILARVIHQAQYAYADGYKLASDAKIISNRNVEFLPSTRAINYLLSPPKKQTAPYNLLFLGRWHHNKGIDILLDSLQLLSNDDWKQIKIIEIYGGGSLHSIVHEKVKKLQLAGKPIKLGSFLNKKEAEDALFRTDWVLIPSRIESIPVIFSDAMKMGKPIISMPTGDLPRLVNSPPCGILAKEISVDSYTIAIRQALSTTTSRFQDGIKKQAEAFNLPILAQNLLKKIQNES